MFQFSELASLRITCLQHARLSHSEIRGYITRVQFPPAYRSLPRPSSPLRPKAFTMRPYFALKFLILKVTLGIYLPNMSKNFNHLTGDSFADVFIFTRTRPS
jgi:hypothetical protein